MIVCVVPETGESKANELKDSPSGPHCWKVTVGIFAPLPCHKFFSQPDPFLLPSPCDIDFTTREHKYQTTAEATACTHLCVHFSVKKKSSKSDNSN